MSNNVESAIAQQRRETPFFKRQLAHARDAWFIIAISFVCFLILVAITIWENLAHLGIIVYLNLALVGLVVAAVYVIRSNRVNEDWAWLITGTAILIVSVYFTIEIETSGNKQAPFKIIAQTMTLIWAPIASAMIVGPIMKVKPKP